MNKLILILSMALLSCDAKPEEKKNLGENELSKETENYHQRVIEYKYEGCEYIRVGFGKSYGGRTKVTVQTLSMGLNRLILIE